MLLWLFLNDNDDDDEKYWSIFLEYSTMKNCGNLKPIFMSIPNKIVYSLIIACEEAMSNE